MRLAYGRLAVIAVAAALSTGAAAAQEGSNACLMTKDEFASASGSTVYSDPEAVAMGTGSVCTYGRGGQIFLFSGDAAREELEGIWAISGVGQNRTPVPELGADAYAFFVEPQNEYQSPTAFVNFGSGPHGVAVSVTGEDGQSAEAALPKAVSVAQAVAAKLP